MPGSATGKLARCHEAADAAARRYFAAAAGLTLLEQQIELLKRHQRQFEELCERGRARNERIAALVNAPVQEGE